MKKHYVCQMLNPNINDPLIFDWDIESGSVSGPGAVELAPFANAGGETIMVREWASHVLSKEPLKNKVDMAAIIGQYYELPEDLAPYYPYVPLGKKTLQDVLDGKAIL